MKRNILLTILLTFSITILFGQEMYIKEYGNYKNPPILFLHGGPGFNSINFELSTAQKLADNGYFVIVYDRTGEGRSRELKSNYTFEECINDIDNILVKYNLNKINLLAHSFGGLIATKYAEKNASKVESIIFISAPFSYQNILKETLSSLKKIYTENNDSVNLNYIKMIENMNTESLEYNSYILMHAIANKFYSPKNKTLEAQNLYSLINSNEEYIENSKNINYNSTLGYWKNEKYTGIDLRSSISKNLNEKIHLYGIYGDEDGIIPKNEIENIKETISKNNVIILEGSSHNLFIDQQDLFIESIKNWVK